MKKMLSMLTMVSLMFSLILTGCGNKPATDAAESNNSQTEASTSTSNDGTSKLDPVNLTWYVVGTPQRDQAAVMEEVNKVLKEKINTTLTVNIIDWGQFDEKMKVIIASGEPWDLAFTSNWANDFLGNVAKGAFSPLDELLDKYGKSVKETVPAKYWDAAKIDGKIYSLINYQVSGKVDGFWAQKGLIEKYNFDYKNVKKVADIEPYLAKIKESEPGIVPISVVPDGLWPFFNLETGLNIEPIGGSVKHPLYYDMASSKVTNIYESKEAMDYFKTMRSWYEKGYIRKDAASVKDNRTDIKAGKYAVWAAGTIAPYGEDDQKTVSYEAVGIPTTSAYLTTGSITSTLTAINKNSKNAERAMMLYNLLYEDKDLYMMLTNGLEGKQFKKVGDKVEYIKDNGYEPKIDWEFGNQFNATLSTTDHPDKWEKHKALNESAAPSPLLGFNLNKSTHKNEYAQIDNVLSEYVPLLATGTVDPEKAIPELNEKLKNAGLDTVIEDAQKQLDDWKAANGK